MTKSELRKKYKALREICQTNQVDDLSIAIANQLLNTYLGILRITICF